MSEGKWRECVAYHKRWAKDSPAYLSDKDGVDVILWADAIIQRCEDAAGMAKMIASKKWGASNWDGLSDSGREHCREIASAVRDYLLGRK